MPSNKVAQRRLRYFLDTSTARDKTDPLNNPVWTCGHNVTEAFDDGVSQRETQTPTASPEYKSVENTHELTAE